MFKQKKQNGKYEWTEHSRIKMQFYGISESRVKRIIRFPKRYEEGIVPNTVAVMQPASFKTLVGKLDWKQEIWVMYKIIKSKIKNQKSKIGNMPLAVPKIKIITAWRYPGKSPEREPIPEEIIKEIQTLL